MAERNANFLPAASLDFTNATSALLSCMHDDMN